VEVVPQADTLVASGSIAVYQPDMNAVELDSPGGHAAGPRNFPIWQVKFANSPWTDLNHWHFDPLELPPGVRIFESQTTMSLERGLPRAVARFGSSGLEGNLHRRCVFRRLRMHFW